jgi:hypothetical protein
MRRKTGTKIRRRRDRRREQERRVAIEVRDKSGKLTRGPWTRRSRRSASPSGSTCRKFRVRISGEVDGGVGGDAWRASPIRSSFGGAELSRFRVMYTWSDFSFAMKPGKLCCFFASL